MKRLIDSIVPPLIALLISWAFVLVPISLSLFNTSQSLREQYSLFDAFTMIRSGGEDYRRSDIGDADITIVDLSDIYERETIADILETVLSRDTRAVGFDIALFDRKDSLNDPRLQSLLENNPRVILPCQLEDETAPDSKSFINVSRQFFLSGTTFPSHNEAAANVDREGVSKVVRRFSPSLYLKDTLIETFPVKILSQANPVLHQQLLSKGSHSRFIPYRNTGFISVHGSAEILNSNLDLLDGRIVLVGDLSDEADKFNTPVDYRMPGVVLNAMIIGSLLRGEQIYDVPTWVSWVLAYVFTLLLLPLLRFIRRKSSWAGILNPIIQTLFILLFVFLSYALFNLGSCYIQPMIILLSVGFLEAADSIYDKILSLVNKKKQ